MVLNIDGLTSLGFRVANGKLTKNNGRLVIGALFLTKMMMHQVLYRLLKIK